MRISTCTRRWFTPMSTIPFCIIATFIELARQQSEFGTVVVEGCGSAQETQRLEYGAIDKVRDEMVDMVLRDVPGETP